MRAARELLSDAGEVARRNAIPFIVIAAGLLLVWSTTLEDARAGFRSDERTLAASWIKADKTRGVIERIRRMRSRVSTDVHRLRQNAEQDCAGQPSTRCTDARRRYEGVQRRYNELGRRLDEFRSIEGDLTRSIRQVRERLSQKVSFDVGQGIRLPFTLLLAPLGWLAVLAFLLVRVGMAKALFWRLVRQAEVRSRLGVETPTVPVLVDVPFWLAPLPRTRGDVGRRATLRRMAGWRNSARSKTITMWVVLAVAAMASLRICWIGIYFESVATLPNEILSQLGERSGSLERSWLDQLLGPATVSIAMLDILLLAWLAVPARPNVRTAAPIPARPGRREFFVGAGAVAVSFAVFRLSTWTVQANREQFVSGLRRAMLRLKRRRNRARDVAARALQPGWYFNRRTSAAHLVRADRIIKRAPGLKPTNLEPVSFDGNDIDAPGLWVREEHTVRIREEVALRSLMQGQVWIALNVLAFGRTLLPEGAGAITRRLDLAAGIMIWLEWGAGLARVTEAARQIASGTDLPKLRAQISARIERWNGPAGAKWRRTRWNPAHPLRWTGRKIGRSQISGLELRFADESDAP